MVAAFMLAQHGSAETVHLLRGVLAGLPGFAVFCFLVSVLVDGLGTALGFGVALAGTVVTQLTLQQVVGRRRHEHRTRSQPRDDMPTVNDPI